MDPLSLLSLGSTALSGFGKAASSIMSGDQQSQMDAYQAQRMADASEIGKAAASQTDMTMRQQLQQTMGNMMAVRASANTSAESPTGQAILNRTQGQGDQQRQIQVGNQMAQVAEDQQASQMYATAGQQTSLFSSVLGGLGAGSTLLSAMSGLNFGGLKL